MLPIPLLCLTLLPSTLAHTQSTLFHRIYHPLDPPVQFSQRGSILISDSSATFQPAETYSDDLKYFADTLQSLDGALYEIALEREGDPTDWVFSSVKAVRLIPMLTWPFIVLFFNSVTCSCTLKITLSFTYLIMANHSLSTILYHLYPIMALVPKPKNQIPSYSLHL
jgi:hypothetical protein